MQRKHPALILVGIILLVGLVVILQSLTTRAPHALVAIKTPPEVTASLTTSAAPAPLAAGATDQISATWTPTEAQAKLPTRQVTIFRADGREVTLNAEMALTPQQQETGLMFRDSVPEGQAMLFVFPQPQPVSFWMKNVKMPLDIIFIREGGQVSAIVTGKAGDETPLKSPDATKAVLEIAGGAAAKFGFKPRDQVVLPAAQAGADLAAPTASSAPAVPAPVAAPPVRAATPAPAIRSMGAPPPAAADDQAPAGNNIRTLNGLPQDTVMPSDSGMMGGGSSDDNNQQPPSSRESDPSDGDHEGTSPPPQ